MWIIVAISLLDDLLLSPLSFSPLVSLHLSSCSLHLSKLLSILSHYLSFLERREIDTIFQQATTTTTTTPPHINFSDTSRGPTTKCHTFLETSHDPWLISELKYLELVIWRITIKIVTIHFIFFLIWNIASPWHFWWIMMMMIIMMMMMIMWWWSWWWWWWSWWWWSYHDHDDHDDNHEDIHDDNHDDDHSQ